MKILLTGKNRSGKTTLLNELINLENRKRGFLTLEVRDQNDRIGFDLVSHQNHKAALAHTTIRTNHSVGRYFVNEHSLDDFLDPLYNFSANELLYIDEIGQMQLLSDTFKTLVGHYLNSDNDYVGTISALFEDPFIEEVKSRPDVLLCIITPENRHAMLDALSVALANRRLFNDLAPEQKETTLALARHYLEINQFVSFKKLFKNALRYVIEHRAIRRDDGTFSVTGNHDEHKIKRADSRYQCDCDFFNGLGQFVGHSGECSHIQANKIIYP